MVQPQTACRLPTYHFRFALSSRFLHRNTRIHVRLLGPCFKTGRMRPCGRDPQRTGGPYPWKEQTECTLLLQMCPASPLPKDEHGYPAEAFSLYLGQRGRIRRSACNCRGPEAPRIPFRTLFPSPSILPRPPADEKYIPKETHVPRRERPKRPARPQDTTPPPRD